MAKSPANKPGTVNVGAFSHNGQPLNQSSPLSPAHESSDTETPGSPSAENHSNNPASNRLRALKKSSRLKAVAAETRKEIRKHIRNDWDWPLPEISQPDQPDEEQPSGALPDAADHVNQPERPRNAWASRINDETMFLERDPGSEPDSDREEDERLTAEKRNGVEAPNFKYESPDSVQQTADAEVGEVNIRWRRLEARRQGYVKELQENEGLRNFEARRNAWTGAVLAPRLSDQKTFIHDRNVRFKRVDPSNDSSNGPYEFPTRKSLKARVMRLKAESTRSNANGQGSTMNAKASDEDGGSEESSIIPTSNAETASRSTTESQSTEPSPSATDPEILMQDEKLIPYVPIAPPLIDADNEIRGEIKESTYNHIYSKVVVQGTTPSVPINLKDMTRSLVAGWKADEEWPPKQSILDPLVGRRRGRGGAQAGGAKGKEGGWLKKVLRITGASSRSDEHLQEAPGLVG